MSSPPDAVEQDIEIGAQPHGQCLGTHQRPRLGVHIGAAAGRQHMRRFVEQAGDDAALAGAELGLAVFLEELADRAAGRMLDLVVGIDERQAEARGQPLADRALARTHQPYEGDGARHGKGGKGVHDELQTCMSPIPPVVSSDRAQSGHDGAGVAIAAPGQLPSGNCRSGGSRVVCPRRAPVPLSKSFPRPHPEAWSDGGGHNRRRPDRRPGGARSHRAPTANAPFRGSRAQ